MAHISIAVCTKNRQSFAGVPLYSEVAMSDMAFSLDLGIILFCDYITVFLK